MIESCHMKKQTKGSTKAPSKAPAKAPKLNFKMKTKWDFSPLYNGIDDPKIESDMKAIEMAHAKFAEKYSKDASYVNDDQQLFQSIKAYETLSAEAGNSKPCFFLHHLRNTDSSNQKVQAKLTQMTERLTKAQNLILFFQINLTKISKERQGKILKDPLFKDYSYFLEKIFIKSKYTLSESEEKILSLKTQTSYQMWVDAQQKLLNAQMVKYKGKNIPIQDAMILQKKLPTKQRYALYDAVMLKHKEIAFMAEAELNAIITDKKIDDELRGAKTPYEITVVEYENDVKTVENLVETVTKNMKITHDFYKAKASLMGMKKMRMADRLVEITKTKKKVTFDQTVSIVHDAFMSADPFFADFLREMLEKGQIDVFPQKGKRDGAYCTDSPKSLPIYVLMNFDGTMDGVKTLAHEMGHAIHTKLGFSQPELYVNYPISIAEVASTFFEQIVSEHTMDSLSEEEKAIALLNDVERSVSTIFRQIQFFNYEKDLHKAIREKGSISKEEMADLYLKRAVETNGPALQTIPNDGYAFIPVPHFRYFFYVYAYAYGLIISKALFAKYKEDHSFIEKVKQFLSSGGSKSPYEVFKSIGIDTSKPEFFEEGIKQIRQELDTAVKLAKKVGLIKK